MADRAVALSGKTGLFAAALVAGLGAFVGVVDSGYPWIVHVAVGPLLISLGRDMFRNPASRAGDLIRSRIAGCLGLSYRRDAGRFPIDSFERNDLLPKHSERWLEDLVFGEGELADGGCAVGAELRGGLPGAQEAARHHLVLFLISLWRISSPQPMRVQSAPRAIVRNFLHLVELHLSDHWSVGDYAQFLSVSRARLTSAVKRVTGRTPLQLIHERLLSEAETLLSESNLQVSEIADTLGFKDAGYFNRFFKRETGRRPGDVRRAGPRKARPIGTFAEWP